MRSLIATAVRRRVAVLMCLLAATAFGIVGYKRLPLDLLPDMSYPSLTVQTEFPDTAPAEVENLITRPVEETVGVLRGLRTIHSVSRAGLSEVILEFDWDSDMDLLSMDVREKLDRLVLPEEAEDPIVLRYDPSLDPILRLALTGTGDLGLMREVAEERLKQEFESVKGVAAAQVKGGLEDEIQVNVDQERLAARGIPLDRVQQVVGFSNVNLPGGALEDRNSRYIIRTLNEFDSVEEIGALILRQDQAGIVRVRDVAEVIRGYKEREEITRVDGTEAVELDIYKEGDSNIVATARAVRRRLEDVKTDLPPGFHLVVLFDQSRFIEKSVNEVRSSAVLGGILAILVLFAFLRDIRSTLIIATAIPASIVVAFMAMYRLGLSLNIMSLGGLTLGVGMLVDNAIVVLECIFQKREEGHPLVRAAVEGAAEVANAVTASTLTTVAVFIPIIFVEGVAGQLFGDMAITVTVSLLASLAVALTLIPMLAATGREAAVAESGRASHRGGTRTLGRFSRIYDRAVRGALRRRRFVLGGAFLLFVLSMGVLIRMGTDLIPEISEGEFSVEVNLPEGASLAATDRLMKSLESEIAKEPGVERDFVTVGSRLVAGGISLNTKGENLGQIHVVMKDRADEEGEAKATERLRRNFTGIPDLETKFAKPSYFTFRTPIEIVLYGESLERLRDYSLDLREALDAVPGLADVRSSLEAGSPELQVVFDRQRLASLGLDLRTLSETLRDRIQGAVPTRFKEEDRQIDIRIRNQEENRANLDDIRNLVVPGPEGQPLRLVTVADVRTERGPVEIHRVQQQRAALVTANLEGVSLGAATRAVREALSRMPPPPGISWEIGGQNEEMRVSYGSLRFALLLAVFLVYLVMAATFESLIHPLIVLFTVPLGLVGVALGLVLTGTEISVIVLIGVVLLVGVVVNNAIVLIDRVNQLRRAGWDKEEALVEAGHTRLRPILMTTLTTILGLIPMALSVGEGAELRSPLAITVCFGLAAGTLLTLVVIPCAYAWAPSRIAVEEEAGDLPPRAEAAHASATAHLPAPAEGGGRS